MKTLILRILMMLCASGMLVSATAQMAPNGPPEGAPEPGTTPPPDEVTTNGQPGSPPADDSARPAGQPAAPAAGKQPFAANAAATAAAASSVEQDSISADSGLSLPATGTNYDELSLNFRNVPLEMVLNYLSEAAGFIIVLDTPVSGTVSVISSHPMTRDEAVDLLNSVLNQNGFAAIRNGRTLTIVGKNDAKTRNIPVKTSNDPDSIPDNAEIVTQIIPIRFVEARQLVTDLSSFVSPQATIVANEAGNSIVVTDTQSNIRHLTEIIRAIDNSAEGETEIRVFHLTHASPADVANELSQIFPSNNGSGSQVQTPFRFGGGGGFGGFPGFGGFGGFGGRGGGGGGGGGNAAGNNSSNSRVQKQTQVVAVADLRTSSVVVTASKDLMQEIAGMMEQLDVPSTRDQKVFVYHMENGDPQQALTVLQNMFQNNSASSRSGTSSSSQNSALQTRETQNATSGGTGSTTTSGTSTGIGGGTSRGAGGPTF
jgi:type II secretory pathway component GspD/PulD (secretin)